MLHTRLCAASRKTKAPGVFFMPAQYEICADESWTHESKPLNRYWCFYGGLFGEQSAVDSLESGLQKVKAASAFQREVKWSNVKPLDLPLFKQLIDEFFRHLIEFGLTYRQVFLDRSFIHVPSPGDPAVSSLDVQYKICYQFLKHAFGISHLPVASGGKTKVFIRLDRHSSQKHCARLAGFLIDLPAQLRRLDIEFHVSFINSVKILRLGVCDVIMGAAGSYGNGQHLHRQNGQRGMTANQSARYELAKYIYAKMKAVNALRGAKAFNWFESTGHDGDASNRLSHKLRIWKFKPKKFQIDKGWQNDHLDAQGGYVAPDIQSTIYTN